MIVAARRAALAPSLALGPAAAVEGAVVADAN